MSTWNGTGCPDIEDLLCGLAGDLSPAERAALVAHVDECLACRAQLRDVEAITRAAADALAPPSDPGVDQRRAAFRQQMHVRQLAQIHHVAGGPTRRWAPALAALALVVTLGTLLRPLRLSLGAEELLARAAQDEAARPARTVQQVRIRLDPPTGLARGTRLGFSPMSWIRDIGADTAQVRPELRGDAASLLATVAQYGFDMGRPLSVSGLRAWRARSSGLRDTVTFNGSVWVLRTRVGEGLLRVVEVAAQWNTYHVVRQTLIVEGLGRVDVEEFGERVKREDVPDDTAALLALGTLDETELDVRLVLRGADLDLGRAARVSRTSAGVRVEGEAPPAIRRVVQQQLARLAHVDVALTGAAPLLSASMGASDGGAGLSAWVARTYGTETSAGRAFEPELVAALTTVRERLTALRTLASRYPNAIAERLSPAARRKLRQLLDAHYAGLSADLGIVDKDLALMFGSAPRCIPLLAAPADWARRAGESDPLAARVAQLVEALRRRDHFATGDEQSAAATIRPAFDALWLTVNSCRTAVPVRH